MQKTISKLSAVRQKFILRWGEMGTNWGINRAVARIHALLFIETPDLIPPGTRGWVFYDGACALCARGVARWSGPWARRGFLWLPLQTEGAAARLGVSDQDLLAEMHLLLPGHRVRCGVDAWAALLRAIWWLWPLGALLAIPGFRQIGRSSYRWLACNRHCLGGNCDMRATGASQPNHARHGASSFWGMP